MSISVFIAYADEDKDLLDIFERHLIQLIREKLISVWRGQKISAGVVRDVAIREHLSTAKIILLLISSDFMASDSCYSIMEQAMEQHRQRDVPVIPILLRPVNWQKASFSKLQVLPRNNKPITKWSDQDEAFLDVVDGIQEVIEKSPPTSVQSARQDNLPPRPDTFFGRKKEIIQALKGLRRSGQLISVEGMGGVGKTMFALHIAHSCLPGPQTRLKIPFDYGVWVSAKDRPRQSIELNEILDKIAEVLGHPPITQLPIEQKKVLIDWHLRRHRTLIVVDNFETINDPDLETWIKSIPEPSKILVIGRSKLSQKAWAVDLQGLDTKSALKLIHEHSRRLGLPLIDHKEALLPLVEATEGNPKAIAPYKNYELIDFEWPNLEEVLVWADKEGQDEILIELTFLLAHHMSRCMQFLMRIKYARKAAQAASRLGRKQDAALLRIDAYGWVLLEVGRTKDGREEITEALKTLDPSSADDTDLIALGKAWLAKALLAREAFGQEELAKASVLIEEAMSLEPKNLAIQRRVNTMAGDIAYEKSENEKARQFYESANDISEKYNGQGEGTHARLGNTYLALKNSR